MRSEDAGGSFERVAVESEVSLQNIVCTASSQVFAVGKDGKLLCSLDDGRSFFDVVHRNGKQWLFAAIVVDERLDIAGVGGRVSVVAPARAQR